MLLCKSLRSFDVSEERNVLNVFDLFLEIINEITCVALELFSELSL